MGARDAPLHNGGKLQIFFKQRLIAVIIAVLMAFMFPATAEAATTNFQWTGRGGYSAKASFSYNEKIAPKIILEQGNGKTRWLDSLIITFYNPAGHPIGTYENIANGIAKGDYFRFNFNRETGQVLGLIDLGGEKSGEIYLKGRMDEHLSLFSVGKMGSDRAIDENAGNS